MSISFQYQFTDEMIERAVSLRELNAKFARASLPFIVVITGFGLILLLETQWDYLHQVLQDWFKVVFFVITGIWGLMLAMQGLMLLGSYLTRRSLYRWKAAISDPTIEWKINPEGFQILMRDRHRDVPWHQVRRLKMVSHYWTIQLHDGSEIYFPAEIAPEEARNQIRHSLATKV